MTDRPILFSAAMVKALLGRRKTQTRRLASSPLRLVMPGDQLWVREAWRVHRALDDKKPSWIATGERVWYDADRDNCDQHGRPRPGMFMPRWASRLTLTVTAVRIMRLTDCSEADAVAEGVLEDSADGWPVFYVSGSDAPHRATARECYAGLWDTINGSGAWLSDPMVVALTFVVHQVNIDGA